MTTPDADLTAVVTRPLGRYRLVSRIGEGGMGVVHLALDPAGQPVAVKVLKAHIAGVVDEAGNVMGLMPHPEHAVDPLLGSADGALVLASLVDAARERLGLAVV